MKKLSLTTTAICLLISSTFKAQVTSPNNNSAFGQQYVGFSSAGPGPAKPLDLINGFNNQPLRFFTNNSGANGLAGATQRMTITPTGLVGLSNL